MYLRNNPWCSKTRMMVLSDGERISMIRSAVLIQYTRVTDRRTDGWTELAWHIRAIAYMPSRVKIKMATWKNLGDDPDHRPDPGVRSPKSGFTGLSKKYLMHLDQSCIANLHCKNHSAILLCWRSAEVYALWVLLVSLFYAVKIHRLTQQYPAVFDKQQTDTFTS